MRQPRNRTGWRRLCVVLSPEKIELVKDAAHSANTTVTAWLAMAVNSYLGRWRDPSARRKEQVAKDSKTHPSGWPKDLPCYRCQQKHDPTVHGESAQDVRIVLRLREAGAVQAVQPPWIVTPEPTPEPPAYAPAGEGE